jgi:hypothetical protein
MRAIVSAAVLAATMLAVIAPMSRAASDAVTGTGRHQGADPPFPFIQVHINAFDNAAGDARGQLISDMTNSTDVGKYTGRVTCLSVFPSPFGNEATVGIEIVDASSGSLVGQGQLWSVVDNGTEDRIAGFPPTPTPPTVCPALFFNVPVVSGNYVVR